MLGPQISAIQPVDKSDLCVLLTILREISTFIVFIFVSEGEGQGCVFCEEF